MADFITKLIKWGLFLGAINQLKPATMYFMHEATKSHQQGLISLTALNRSLGIPAEPRRKHGHHSQQIHHDSAR